MVLIMEYCNGGELFNKICAESEASFHHTQGYPDRWVWSVIRRIDRSVGKL